MVIMSNAKTSNTFRVRSEHDEHNNVPDALTHSVKIGPEERDRESNGGVVRRRGDQYRDEHESV